MLVTVRALLLIGAHCIGTASRLVACGACYNRSPTEQSEVWQDFMERGDLHQILEADTERRFSWHRRCTEHKILITLLTEPMALSGCTLCTGLPTVLSNAYRRLLRSLLFWCRQSRAGHFVPHTGMARSVALDIARGLHYLHSRSPKIVHFDLKASTHLALHLDRAACCRASSKKRPLV